MFPPRHVLLICSYPPSSTLYPQSRMNFVPLPFSRHFCCRRPPSPRLLPDLYFLVTRQEYLYPLLVWYPLSITNNAPPSECKRWSDFPF